VRVSGQPADPPATLAGAGLAELLAATASLHDHLCPRQVLGVRMGVLAGRVLGLPVPQVDKRLLCIMETDGCASDGVAVATHCRVGRRTMRIEDYGKVAATFVDTRHERAVRIAPQPSARERAAAYAPQASSRWEAMLLGYQRMPDVELLVARPVRLKVPVERLVSRPGRRVPCAECGEEIMNEREVMLGGRVLCRGCAGQGYYEILG
jgi:formylmethanofuran dehydrogenase subunit E